jgi:hypothetical protein
VASRRLVARSLLTTPECAADINLDWVTSALGPQHRSCTPIAIELDSNYGGPSLLGRIVRVKFRYATAGCRPESVIVKFQARASDWEAQIYRLLAESELRCVPKLIGAFDRGTLLMQDLWPLRPGSQLEGCTLEQARQVLALLAEVHGRFWGDERVPSLEPGRFASAIRVNMTECWESFAARYREMLGDAAADFQWMRQNAAAVSAHRLSGPTTLFHGDVHMENILFGPEERSQPVLVDWQLAGRGLAANDVSFFLLKSISAELRRAKEDELLREYYGQLPGRVRRTYPFGVFKLDYRACATRSIVSAVMLVGPRFADRQDQQRLADAVAERVIAAVLDLRPVEALGQTGVV